MEDPLPENITGSKEVQHAVNHEINWGHVALGVAVIVLAMKFGPPVLRATGVARSDGEEADTRPL